MIHPLPANLDLDQLLRDSPPWEVSNVTTFKRAHLVHLLGLLTVVPGRNKKIADAMVDGYVPLHAETMKNHVYHYNRYIDYLRRVKVIETTGSFTRRVVDKSGAVVTNGSCRKYRFQALYRAQPCRCELQPSSWKARMAQAVLLRPFQPAYGHLLRWLEGDGRLEIDAEGARLFALRRLALLQAHPELRKVKPRAGRKMSDRASELELRYWRRRAEFSDPLAQHAHAEYNICRIENREMRAKIDGKVDRLHSNLTNINGALRDFLTFEGDTLVSIDIANSQPYLANLLLQPGFYDEVKGQSNRRGVRVQDSKKNGELGVGGDKEGVVGVEKGVKRAGTELGVGVGVKGERALRYGREGRRIKEEREKVEKGCPYITLVQECQSADNEDVELFARLTSKGELYEYLRCAFEEKLGPEYANKDNAKVAIFEVLFAGNGYNSKMKRVFTKLFPTIARAFNIFKRGRKNILPRLLQMLEAHIILRVVTKRIAKEKRNQVPLFTIHDSIVTTQEHAAYVRDVMREELTRLIGIPPTLKMEVWSPAHADQLLADLEAKVQVADVVA